jgi:hypothetical protein
MEGNNIKPSGELSHQITGGETNREFSPEKPEFGQETSKPIEPVAEQTPDAQEPEVEKFYQSSEKPNAEAQASPDLAQAESSTEETPMNVSEINPQYLRGSLDESGIIGLQDAVADPANADILEESK